MTSAFAAAAESVSQQAPVQAYGATPNQAQDTAGNLTDSFVGQPSQLFSGPTLAPSLFNKSHVLGTVRTGVLTAAPYDVQARDYNTKMPKFFLATPEDIGGKLRKVGPRSVDQITGKPNNPVMDTVIELATDYRFDAAESAAISRDPNLPDDGARAFYASGDELKQLRAEIRRLGFRSEQDMIGAKLTVTRVSQKPNTNGYPSWITKVELSR